MSNTLHYQETICAVLRGESDAWPHGNADEDCREFSRCAGYHGVAGLVYHALKQSQWLSVWPGALVDSLRRDAMYESAREAMRSRELSAVLTELAQAAVYPLLLKGTPLAYVLYPEAALRQRSDTDLLIPPSDRDALSRVLTRLGYVRGKSIEGELVSSQSSYSRTDLWGISHDLDVHWRVSNYHIFADLLGYDELASHAVAVGALGPHARTLRPVDALMLACMHRLAHQQAPYYVDGEAHYDSHRLIWLYDIHLLAQRLTADQWQEFASGAARRQLELVCWDGLNVARQAFGTVIPAWIQATFTSSPRPEALHVSRFHVPRWRWELAELGALPSWRLRFKQLKEHLAPSSAYLVEKYQLKNRRWLPLLYVRRALAGGWKRLHSRVAKAALPER